MPPPSTVNSLSFLELQSSTCTQLSQVANIHNLLYLWSKVLNLVPLSKRSRGLMSPNLCPRPHLWNDAMAAIVEGTVKGKLHGVPLFKRTAG